MDGSLSSELGILGAGVYSPRQAARLVGSSPQEVLRWTRGSGPQEPLWTAYYTEIPESSDLNFTDLIELRVVKGFRKAGVSLQAVRFAIEFAQERFDIERPLSTLRFKTDGQDIFFEALDRDGHLVSLKRKNAGQRIFAEIIDQSLSDVEFDGGAAVRWRPAKHSAVVIDPARAFGDPILDAYGISTATLARERALFKDNEYLSRIYEIPVSEIRKALRYESSLAA